MHSESAGLIVLAGMSIPESEAVPSSPDQYANRVESGEGSSGRATGLPGSGNSSRMIPSLRFPATSLVKKAIWFSSWPRRRRCAKKKDFL